MDAELKQILEAAGLPAELKAALAELAQAAYALEPELPMNRARRLVGYTDYLIEQVVDPAQETVWWEVLLALVSQIAAEAGAGSQTRQAFERAVEQAKPLLQRQLPVEGPVTLQEITSDTVHGICLLSDTLTVPKMMYVAPNAISLAQAHFNKYAWFRAIYAGKAPVGFVMLVDDPDKPEYFIWRYMIAQPYHGRGFGWQAMERVVEYVRGRPGAKELLLSCGQGEGSPEGFYHKFGFAPTGDKLGHEIVMRLGL